MSCPPKFFTDPGRVPLNSTRPLLIVDADEVLLRFAAGLDRYLHDNGLYLDLTSYRLHGNIKRLDDNAPVLDIEVTALLHDFRAELDSLEAVEYAQKALTRLGEDLDIVVLSNVTPSQALPRLRNFATLGFPFPLVTNSGPKGAAVKVLAQRGGRPTFFVDDIPHHHASVAETSPDVLRIHLIGDERLKPLLPVSPHAHLRADSWLEAEAFIRKQLDGGSCA